MTEGHLRASQEGEVLRLLRDTVGGLQDLVEANRTGGGSPDKVKRARRAEEGGAERTAGSPRDTGGKEKKKHPEVEEKEAATRAEEAVPEGEEGSYTSYETVDSPVVEEAPRADELPPARGGLARALNLKATGKASAAPRTRSPSRRDHSDRAEGHRDQSSRRDDGGDHRGELPRANRGSIRPREPDHPPPRRENQGEKHKHKKKVECGVSNTTDAKRGDGAKGQSEGWSKAQGQAGYSGQASGGDPRKGSRRSSSRRSQRRHEETSRSACRYSLGIGSHHEVLGGQLGGVRERPGGSGEFWSLLRGGREGSRPSSKGGSWRRPETCVVDLDRDRPRGRPEDVHSRAPDPVPTSSMSGRLRTSRERGQICPRHPRPEGLGRDRRGGLGLQPSRGEARGGSPSGRASGIKRSRRRISPCGSGGRQGQEEGQGNFVIEQGQEEEEEGEKEKEKEERGGGRRREKASHQLPERDKEPVQWDRTRPARSCEEASDQACKGLPSESNDPDWTSFASDENVLKKTMSFESTTSFEPQSQKC